MDSDALLRLIRSFADDPNEVIVDRDQVSFELQSVTHTLIFESSLDGTIVNDGSARFPAHRWAIETLAQLPVLARRIQSNLESPTALVAPACRFEQNYSSPSAVITGELPDALSAARAWCDNQYAFASRVLYLTSDAGEGKTTCINALAHTQAKRFLSKQSPWILLPVALGGRPFLRLDEVIIAALSQIYRFQRLYIEAFVELVRLGVVVLALDGFEEMLVDGQAGDAISALGNLLTMLGSRGTVIIAARRAFFDYKSLETQSKLFDSIRSVEVEFARLHLMRWDKERFVAYASAMKCQEPDNLYSKWLARVRTPNHPLLCRPVLVKHLVKLGESDKDENRREDLEGEDPEQYYTPFIREIVSREAHQKWLNFDDDPASPLLSVGEHFGLLASVAREMWTSEAEIVPVDLLDFAAELFCAEARKTPEVTRRVVDRLKAHALMGSSLDKRRFHFDHEEFFHYFLGLAIASDCIGSSSIAAERILRDRPIPLMAIEMAAAEIRAAGAGSRCVGILKGLCESEQGYTALKENCGNLCILVLQGGKNADPITLTGMAVTHGLLGGRVIDNIVFEACYFGPMELSHSTFTRCMFKESRFQTLDFDKSTSISECAIVKCDIDSVSHVVDESLPDASIVYSPVEVVSVLRHAGFDVREATRVAEREPAPTPQVDERMRVLQRFLRVFSRATGVSDGVIRQRLGAECACFLTDVLPPLVQVGVVLEVEWRGGGQQRRFRLGLPMHTIQLALERSRGSFDAFIINCSEA